MIQVKAPGKLYIAGEYAVVEPGYKSILIAVDRFVTASIEDSNATQGTIHSRLYIMNQSHFKDVKIKL